jgi:hypothetical protein
MWCQADAAYFCRSCQCVFYRIVIAGISPSEPAHGIGLRDVIEGVEDRIDGFTAEVWFSQPFRTRMPSSNKLANRHRREVAMAAIVSPPVPQMECGDHTRMDARTAPVDIQDRRVPGNDIDAGLLQSMRCPSVIWHRCFKNLLRFGEVARCWAYPARAFGGR